METRLLEFFKHHKLTPAQQTSRSFIFDCPACGGEKKLYIQREDGRSACFKRKTEKCPKPGSLPSYALSLLTHLPIDVVKREIFDFVAHLTDEISVSFDDESEKAVDAPLSPGYLPLDTLFISDPSAAEGTNYLEGRGLPKDVQAMYDILYVPSMRRVVFPVIMGKTLYGWQGRAIDKVKKEHRMHNMEGGWKAKTLMFYNNIQNKDFAIIAEGPISALKFHSVGNFVASMGKELSKKQLDLIREAGVKKLYLALDRDAVDKLASIRYYMDNELSGKVECYIIDVPDHRDDFGDCTFEECEQAFREAKKMDGDELFSHIEFKLSKYDSRKA